MDEKPNLSKTRRMRRCLGPGQPPHDFMSDGPGNRVCPKCKVSQREVRLSRREEFQQRVHEEKE